MNCSEAYDIKWGDEMKNTLCRILTFLIAYIAAVAVAYAAVPSAVLYWIAVLIFAVPLTLYGCSRFVSFRRDELSVIEKNTLFVRFRTNSILPYLLSIIVGIAYGIYLPVYLVTLPLAEHAITIILIALVLIADSIIASQSPYKEANREYRSRGIRNFFAVFAGGFLYALILFFADISSAEFPAASLEGNNTAFVIAVVINAINSINSSIMNTETVNSTGLLQLLAIFCFLASGL